MRCLAGLIAAVLAATPVTAACRLEGGLEKSVGRAIDAETLLLDDGSRVRLAGIIGPRRGDVGAEIETWPPEQAALSALRELAVGRSVTLRFEGARQDRYGRWVAHAFVGGAATTLQEALVRTGHARVEAARGQRACAETLLDAEAEARGKGLGLWREAAYRVRAAEPARDLTPYQGSFQILAGRVEDVSQLRDVWRLRLGGDRRRSVTLTVRADDRDTLGALLGGDPRSMNGQSIEARGWLVTTVRGALEIDLSTVGYLKRR